MKKTSLIIIAIILTVNVFAQSKENQIIGKWYNEEKNALIEIYEDKGEYLGKIIWILNPLDKNGSPLKDPLNPNERLRSRERLGMVIMKGFTYDGNNHWDNGNIYDPASGNDYSAYLDLKSNNTIDLRGFVGISIFGRTSTWTRKSN